MRILFTIPHFCASRPRAEQAQHGSQSASASARSEGLAACIGSLHQEFGKKQSMIHVADRRTIGANSTRCAEVHVVVCTTGKEHVMDQLPIPSSLYYHFRTDSDPLLLGFECHSVLRNRWGNYDYYCYLEDDLILRDPWFFPKLAWFNRCVGTDKLLQPNRFERGGKTHERKVYLDGDLSPDITARYRHGGQDATLQSTVMGVPLTFQEPLNPHAGCFFLNAEQMQHWINQPHFGDRDTSFIGPLESAATLGMMKTFQIYKPDCADASFLEVEHFGNRFLQLIRFDGEETG